MHELMRIHILLAVLCMYDHMVVELIIRLMSCQMLITAHKI